MRATFRQSLILTISILVSVQIWNRPFTIRMFSASPPKTSGNLKQANGAHVITETSIVEHGNERIRNDNMTIQEGHNNNNISQQWEPSDEWINSCIQKERKNNADLRKAYPVKWRQYQLGDCLRACRKCGSTVSSSRLGNLSIAGQYWEHVCHRKYESELGMNLTFLVELFQRFKANPFPYLKPWSKPEEDELVIHLRLGDVMDEKQYVGNASVFEMLKRGADTRHGINSYYPHGIKSIHEYLRLIRQSGMKKVVLRGGSHFPKPYPKSKIFSICLAKAIQTAGYNITNIQVHGESNPDQDFYYMSHAKSFVSGTGGYSLLIGMLVEKMGGTVVKEPLVDGIQ